MPVPNRKISQSASAIRNRQISPILRVIASFYPDGRTDMSRDRQLVIRQDEQEHLLWEHRAYERGMTVSEMVRKAVDAYCDGRVGVPFAANCPWRDRHEPGHTCPGCGGSARPSA